VLRLWWLPVVLMLAGGVAGELVFRSRPPLYESQAVFTFSFDYARLGKLLERDEDQVMGAAGVILRNQALFDQLRAEFQAKDKLPAGYDLWAQSAAERKSYRWVLRVRHPHAEITVEIVNRWTELGAAALGEAAGHAERADAQQQALAGLEGCLRRMAVTEPATAQCAWPGLPEVQGQIEAAGQAYLAERAASRGMIAGFYFDLAEKGEAPTRTTSAGRAEQVLFGGILGFMVGFVLAGLGILPAVNKPRINADECGKNTDTGR
jgi:hypothetical protein